MAKDDIAEFKEDCRDMGGEVERLDGTDLNGCVLEDHNEVVLETGDRIDLDSFRE